MTDNGLGLRRRATIRFLTHRCPAVVKLFSYISSVVDDEELANDIFQESFVKAIVKLQRAGSPNCKFAPWLMR